MAKFAPTALVKPAWAGHLIAMSSVFPILIGVAMLATLIVLALGVINMTRGGKSSGQISNKLMQYRVVFQGVALLLFGLMMFFLRR